MGSSAETGKETQRIISLKNYVANLYDNTLLKNDLDGYLEKNVIVHLSSHKKEEEIARNAYGQSIGNDEHILMINNGAGGYKQFSSGFILTDKKMYGRNFGDPYCWKLEDITEISIQKKLLFAHLKINGTSVNECIDKHYLHQGELLVEVMKEIIARCLAEKGTENQTDAKNETTTEIKEDKAAIEPPEMSVSNQDSQNKAEMANLRKLRIQELQNKAKKNIDYEMAKACGFETNKDIDDEELTSFIEYPARGETKDTFLMDDHSIWFFTNTIYYQKVYYLEGVQTSSLNYTKTTYDTITSVVYSEKKANHGEIEKETAIYNKSGEKIYVCYGKRAKQAAMFLAETISKIVGHTIKLEMVKDDAAKERDDFFVLLDKWNEIFKRKDFIINPTIKTARVEYLSHKARVARQEEYFGEKDDLLEDRLIPKTMEVQQYITDKALLEIGTQKSELNFQERKNGQWEKRTSKTTDYYIRYYADKNNKDSYLLFQYDADDFKGSSFIVGNTLPVNFLHLEFKTSETTLGSYLPMSSRERDKCQNLGLYSLLDKNEKHEIYDNLKKFLENPYTLTEDERIRREKLAKEKADAEEQQRLKIEQEKDQQHKATLSALDNF